MKTYLFDFDGTIADTFSILLDVGNTLLVDIGMELIDEKTVNHLRGLTVKEVVKELGIPTSKLPILVARGRKALYARRKELKPIPGVLEAIQQLKQQGHQIGMLTSNSRENVAHFLKQHDTKDAFDFVYTGSSLFGKASMIRKILKKYALHRANVIYIGDEVRDIIAARKAKVHIASVTWGFNARGILETYNPDFVVTKPSQLATRL